MSSYHANCSDSNKWIVSKLEIFFLNKDEKILVLIFRKNGLSQILSKFCLRKRVKTLNFTLVNNAFFACKVSLIHWESPRKNEM